ncbi:MAG: acetyl-CoA carboxylase biotin carboxyl carrier protein [Candidatus Goldbacteria bacterium]|nr:acetyl-CoA carboxylase biotin carboxyl carrier protein [Candidatus Goldiibacteriota bacterium]
MSKNIEKQKKTKIDTTTLQYVLDIMEKNLLNELLYEDGNFKIQLKKAIPQQAIVTVPQIIHNPPVATISNPTVNSMQTPVAEPTPKIKEDENTYVVKSPMVGTFYRAPAPDAPPFINIGDAVEPGKTLCIIEAMKIMNEIKSEVKGKIKEILVENAQAVEYNQPIIIIERG